MAVELNYFPDGRLVRKQIFLDGLANHDDVARKIYVFVSEVAAVGQGIGIGREKTFVRAGYGQGGRSFQSVVSTLAFEIEALQANVACDAFHQLMVTNRL